MSAIEVDDCLLNAYSSAAAITRMVPIQCHAIAMLQTINTLPPIVSLLSPLLCCCWLAA